MQVPSRPVLTRAAIVAAALTALLCLQPEPARGTGGTARVLVLSDQARRYLALQYRAYPTEFLGCMIGELRGRSVVVWRIAPADVDPAHSTPTHVVAEQACEAAGWSPTIGMIHSHPDGERCWYYFPGTEVATSDGQAFSSMAGRDHVRRTHRVDRPRQGRTAAQPARGRPWSCSRYLESVTSLEPQ